jgi:hypothetical protein
MLQNNQIEKLEYIAANLRVLGELQGGAIDKSNRDLATVLYEMGEQITEIVGENQT